MKRFPVVLLAVVVFIAAAGAGLFSAYRFIEPLRNKYETVRVAESQPSVSKLPHYLAVKKSFYRDQKIKVKTVQCADDREALSALESGKADIALVRPSSLIFKKASDLKKNSGPVAVASLDRGTFYHLVSRENKPLEGVQALKNKTVITGPSDSLETMFLENALRDSGVNPYESVTIITNIPEEIKMGALTAGTGHYLALEEKDLPAALARGFYRVLSLKAEFPTAVCVSSPEFMANHPAALQGVANALYMAQTWIRHRTPAQAASAVGTIPGIDRDAFPGLVARYYETGSPPESPALQDKSMDAVVKMLDRSREIPMPVEGKDIMAGQFADTAVKTVNYIPDPVDKKKGLDRLKFWD